MLAKKPSGGEVHLKAGRFGPYVEHNKLRATLPRGTEMSELTLEEGIALLTAKAARPAPKKKAAKTGSKKAAAKKGAAKKGAAKKASAKQAAAQTRGKDAS
jgi:DNA topoisomerase-1